MVYQFDNHNGYTFHLTTQTSNVFLILCTVFSEFFKLMHEVENEDLVFTLETIVDKFGEEMAPYALGLCQNLVRVASSNV